MCTGLLACSDRTLDRVLPDPREFAYGAVVSDDPSATIAARKALFDGGTAADAAVALYFTLAVTAPSAASLGAGGVCLVHNPQSGKVETLDFIAPMASNPAGGESPSAIPTAVRGMAALHGRYGRLPWSDLLANAEHLARSGHAVTNRLAGDLAREAGRILTDDRTRRLFGDQTGATLHAGDHVRQIELGSVLGQIRGRGAGSLYAGPLAARVVEGVRLAGGSLRAEDLRDYLPKWRPPVSAYFGRDQMHVAGPPAVSGLIAAQIWQMLVTDDRYAKTSAEERPHLVVEAARRALAFGSRWYAESDNAANTASQNLSPARARELLADYDPASATAEGNIRLTDITPQAATGSGFATVDGSGMAVVCTVTLYDLFGIGRIAPGTGFFPARAPLPGLPGPDLLGPIMITRPSDQTFRMAVSGAGGFMGATATAQLTAKALLETLPLEKAMRTSRFHPGQTGAVVLTDAGDTAAVEALAGRGNTVQSGVVSSRLNAVLCPGGLPAESIKWSECAAATESRGSGLARVFLIERD